jgi:hypothetical protein
LPKSGVLESLFEDLHEFDATDEFEEEANRRLHAFEEAPLRKKAALLYRWKQAVIKAVYCTTDPKDIPLDDLVLIALHSASDHLSTKYSAKVKSPVTAIRAMCYWCQGEDIGGVRNCTNMVCPLFPFRMGKNPFYGKLADADVAITEDFEEDIAETEEA